MSRPRPFFVTITSAGVFLLGIWNAWRALILLQTSQLLMQLDVTLNPFVRSTMALIWSFLFLSLAVALWQRRAIVRRLLPLSLLLYAVYHMLLLAFFVQAPAARQGWQASAVLYAAAIVWSTWVVRRSAYDSYWRQAKNQSLFTYPLSPFTSIQRGDDGESKN
jgi:hypothetical protein